MEESVFTIEYFVQENLSEFAANATNFTDYNCTASSTAFHSLELIYLLYALVFVVSLLGNGVVCYIVMANPRMRTVTNYFIVNLAISDMLITLFCVPFTSIPMLMQLWPFYHFLCPIVPTVQTASVFVSSYTLVAISVDRYAAIMWPLKPRLAKKTCALVIGMVWLFAVVPAVPSALTIRANQPSLQYEVCDTYMCQEIWTEYGEDYRMVYSQTLLMLQFIIPVSVLIFTYTSIGVVIWCHRIPGEAENCRDQRIARSKRKMIKMMVSVVVVYIICWLPINMYFLLVDMNVVHEEYKAILWLISHWVSMSHPCYNPIIYCYMNNRFRQGYAEVFFALAPCLRTRCANATASSSGRSRMSMPLTSIGGTDSTILHRNNTCTTYISTRRRNGNSIKNNAAAGNHHPSHTTRIPFNQAAPAQMCRTSSVPVGGQYAKRDETMMPLMNRIHTSKKRKASSDDAYYSCDGGEYVESENI